MMIPATKTFKLSKPELKAKQVLEECGLDDPTELPIAEIILGRSAFYEERPLTGKGWEPARRWPPSTAAKSRM